jgi:hypothetical protein
MKPSRSASDTVSKEFFKPGHHQPSLPIFNAFKPPSIVSCHKTVHIFSESITPMQRKEKKMERHMP